MVVSRLTRAIALFCLVCSERCEGVKRCKNKKLNKMNRPVACAGKNFGGQGYGRARRGSGGWSLPLTPENFRKFAKNALFDHIFEKTKIMR